MHATWKKGGSVLDWVTTLDEERHQRDDGATEVDGVAGRVGLGGLGEEGDSRSTFLR